MLKPIIVSCITKSAEKKGENTMIEEIKKYPVATSEDIEVIDSYVEDGLEFSLIKIKTPFGYSREAKMIKPVDGENLAAILFVHWYEPEADDSNMSQFEEEAIELAQSGTVCLLVETLWSDPAFFYNRTQDDDRNNSIEEIINLRRSLDILISGPKVDPTRVAYVGHDFGGMYGITTGSIDSRPTSYVIMASTASFSDWYLYFPELIGEKREQFINMMLEIDPINHLSNLRPAKLFFQFADNDPHVSIESAQKFIDILEDYEFSWYNAGHGLNDIAKKDRLSWLRKVLLGK